MLPVHDASKWHGSTPYNMDTVNERERNILDDLGTKSQQSALIPKSTNNDASALADSMDTLHLGAAKANALPPSSPVARSSPAPKIENDPSHTPMAKVRRTASSTSLGVGSRSATPTLKTKSSLSSLKGSSGGPTPPRSPAARRVSSNLAMNGHASNLASPVEEPTPHPPPTAASVAKDFFQREFQEQKDTSPDLGFTVVLHDSCYGHRYSRPKTSKASLATIVERPERILATVLGVSAAYVRLGSRHAGGENAPHPDRTSSMPFKIQKSTRFVPLTSPVVTSVHGNKWMAELKMMCEGAEAKLAMNGKELIRPNLPMSESSGYDRPKLHEGDLYLCSESLNALEGALGGVLDAVDAVFSSSGPRRAFVGIRPPGHHCADDYPSGFCWLNNVHVGISHAASVHGLTHAAIIDFDLHHGDGSQSITWAHNVKVASLPKNAHSSKKTAIGYFSLHDINSYPCEMGDEEKVKNASLCIENAHGQSIWNVHLQPWKTDAEFWAHYETRYKVLLEKARTFLKTHHDRVASSHNAAPARAAIFISAGFDASEWEGQGMQRHKVNVPTDFYARFTKDINLLANEEGLAVDGRIVSVLEGGYSDRALISGVLSHLSGLASAKAPTQSPNAEPGLGLEMGKRLASTESDQDLDSIRVDSSLRSEVPFHTQWWSPSALEELEALVNPPPPQLPKKPRGPINPTYTTPTQSFAAKVVNQTARRFSSSSQTIRNMVVSDYPIPDVGWAVATQELSKLLTPDRQTRSCKAEELKVESNKGRHSRQSSISMSTDLSEAPEKRMQLRGRKPKTPVEEPKPRPLSHTNRRQTIGNVAELDSEHKDQLAGLPAAQNKHRRVSVASTSLSTTEELPEASSTPIETQQSLSSATRVDPAPVAAPVPNGFATLPGEKSRTKSQSPTRQRVLKKAPAPPHPARVPSTNSKPQAPESSNTLGGVDALTSGVKKMSIKLNVPPKKEPVARETKKKAVKAPRKTTPPTSKSNKGSSQPPALPRPAASSELGSPILTNQHQQAQMAVEAPPQTTPVDPLMSFVDNANISDISTRHAFLDIEPFKQGLAPKTQAKPPPTFLPPDGGAVTATAPVRESAPLPVADVALDSEPPSSTILASSSVPEPVATTDPAQPPPVEPFNTSLVSTSPPTAIATTTTATPPKRLRQDLPVFTANSPIRFGSPKVFSTSHQSQHPHPPHAVPTSAAANAGGRSSSAINGFSPVNVGEGKVMEKEEVKGEPVDIWGVPATPDQRMA